jgi:hypothetical protein
MEGSNNGVVSRQRQLCMATDVNMREEPNYLKYFGDE